MTRFVIPDGVLRSCRALLPIIGLCIGVVAVAACKKDEVKPGYAGDGVPETPQPTGDTEAGPPTVDGAVADVADADGGVCSDITITSVLVDRIAVAADPPVSTGGTLVDGTYDLTLYQAYVGAAGVGGPTGLMARSTLRLTAGVIDQILETSGSSPLTTVVSRSTYSASGSTFATTELCPVIGGAGQRQYTFNDPTLVITDPITKEAFTFVKR